MGTSGSGETVKTVTVPVRGDADDEPDEGFVLNLSNPVNALLPDAQAAATIGFEGEHLLHVVRHRVDREWRCNAPEFENYMEAVEHTARFLDQLQIGDQR